MDREISAEVIFSQNAESLSKIDFEKTDPVQAGIATFLLEEQLWNQETPRGDHLMRCVEAAVRTAVIAERLRCQKLCSEIQNQYLELADATDPDNKDPYIRGYKDGSEDCYASMEDTSLEIAEFDAALAAIEAEKRILDALSDLEDKPEDETAEQPPDLVDELQTEPHEPSFDDEEIEYDRQIAAEKNEEEYEEAY